MEICEALSAAARPCGLSPSRALGEKVRDYIALLEKWNRRISLTSVTDPEELIRFHFLEAFWVAESFLGQVEKLADIGSGAGFPGMAIQLYRPQLPLVLIERNYKKSLFLGQLKEALGLEAELFHGRAEEFPDWDGVDLAVMRALLPSGELLNTLAKHDVSILLLHGRRSPVLPGWQLQRTEKFPLSRNRWVSQYGCFT